MQNLCAQMSVRKSAEKVETQEELVQNNSVLKTLIEKLSLICMPSSLWGVHLDLNKKFLAFSTLKISDEAVKTSKSVVLSETEDNVLKTDVFMNNTLVEIPYISKCVSNVDQLNNVLMAIDAVEFCKYYLLCNHDNQCLIFNLPYMDACSRCLNKTSKVAGNSKKDFSGMADIDMNKLRDITFSNSQKNATNKIDNIPCILCNKIFNVEENLSKHYNDHLVKNDGGYFECTICLNSFEDVIAILEHYNKYHSSVKFIKCSVCNKKFTNVQQLRRHIRNHTGYEVFTCARCNKDCISKHNLKKHSCIISRATPHRSKLHICNICHTRYATNHLLQQHQREHQVHVSLKCKECNKKFDNEDQAENHKIPCQSKRLRYTCRMCDKKFSCVSQRLCHIKKAHPSHTGCLTECGP